MIKLIMLSCATFLLLACSTQDKQYYRLNPQVLQQALQACPTHPPKQISCEELAVLALKVNYLGYQLQVNPQGFGKKILSLQEEFATQQQALLQSFQQPKLISLMAQTKQQLAEHLAIVKWLESPKE